MTKKRTIQILRGTTAQNNAYTGSAGELTMDTTTNELRLHDGSTAGGHVIGSSGGSGYHPDLFDVKWADHICNDVQWLRADTFSWQSGAVYQAAYDHLADDIDGKSLSSETIAGVTVQFYLADDGHKICPDSQESNVISIYNATGVAWYYIIDTVNERFKLPRTQYGVTGLRDTVGNYVEPGLPNITGSIIGASGRGFASSATGCFSVGPLMGTMPTDAANVRGNVYMDASSSSSIYGNSNTVQPPATQMYLYFYVGEFTQTAIENTAGITAETLNNKVDVGHQVIDFQAPTAQNNYTWYRKYADGWVEQGGETTTDGATQTVNLPIEMSNTSYAVLITMQYDSTSALYSRNIGTRTTTSFTAKCNNTRPFVWEVKGMAVA